jgi:hypothetical protein
MRMVANGIHTDVYTSIKPILVLKSLSIDKIFKYGTKYIWKGRKVPINAR